MRKSFEMARCKTDKLRVTRDDWTFLLVTLITFLVVLPLSLGSWPQSAYARLGRYFGVDWFSAEEGPVMRPDESLDAAAHRVHGNREPRVWLLVTIVTVRREGHFYLSRVLARLRRLLDESPALGESVRVLVCNVDREPSGHREAVRWSSVFPTVQRAPSGAAHWARRFEKEQHDYVFCLNASRNEVDFEHVAVLEDDAVPLDDMFHVLRYLTEYLQMKHPGYLYVKMYHPPRLQGYIQPEPWRIAEWLAVSTLSALAVSLRFRSVRRRPVRWVAYFMALVEAIGRAHLLELRRKLGVPFGYNILPATECCFPAVMYSNSSVGRVIDFFQSITCRPGYAKDTALYFHYRHSNEQAFVVEPNLVEHIGLASTLRHPL